MSHHLHKSFTPKQSIFISIMSQRKWPIYKIAKELNVDFNRVKREMKQIFKKPVTPDQPISDELLHEMILLRENNVSYRNLSGCGLA